MAYNPVFACYSSDIIISANMHRQYSWIRRTVWWWTDRIFWFSKHAKYCETTQYLYISYYQLKIKNFYHVHVNQPTIYNTYMFTAGTVSFFTKWRSYKNLQTVCYSFVLSAIILFWHRVMRFDQRHPPKQVYSYRFVPHDNIGQWLTVVTTITICMEFGSEVVKETTDWSTAVI